MDTPAAPALRGAEAETPAGISGLPGIVGQGLRWTHTLCCVVTVAALAGCDTGPRHNSSSLVALAGFGKVS